MKVSKLIPLEALLGRSEEYVQENFVRRTLGKSTGKALELIGKALQTGGNGIVESGWYGTEQAAESIYRLVQELIEQGATVADVGSGAGLPGLCLAIARPDLSLTLIEPLERRVIWLTEVVEDLGLENVDIMRSRAEQAVGYVEADYVTARAVSALVGLLDITLPILRGTGQRLALKGRTATEEITQAKKKLNKYGARKTEILLAGENLLEEPTTVVRVTL